MISLKIHSFKAYCNYINLKMKKLFFVFVLLIPLITHAQTIKTDVLILGSNNAAFAAGLQVFKSGAKAFVLTQHAKFDLSKINESQPKEIQDLYQAVQQIEERLNKAKNDALPLKQKEIKNKIDSSLFFKVLNNATCKEIKRSGSGWELKLNDGRFIKAKVLVLADQSDELLKSLKVNALKPIQLNDLSYKENLYRTSVAGVDSAGRAKFLSLYNLLIPDQENLLYLSTDHFKVGQAIGATVAYAAFFETKTSLSDLKKIQTELLKYKLSILPFDDFKEEDPNWLAAQKVGITGILKADIKNGKAFFNPDKEVAYNEIKQPLKDYYYKAQLWFDDHLNAPINLENTISLVSMLGNKSPEATKTKLETDWSKSYKFKSAFDLKKRLTRIEFAVIVNDYLQIFDQYAVDKTGRIIR